VLASDKQPDEDEDLRNSRLSRLEAMVANNPSGERPADNGAHAGQTRFRRGQAHADEQTLADADQTLADADQTLADADHTLADTDQTLADTDQSSSDTDQSSSDSDQLAADRDQEASDHDLAHGGDPAAHELSRDIRQSSAQDREQAAATRLHTAMLRDVGARARDVAALARDQAAAARDLAMARHDRAHGNDSSRALTGGDIVLRAAEQRRRAARHRATAADHRGLAAEDRDAALRDREQAARDRLHALADREALARQLALAETDALTGVRTRAAGLMDLDLELDRCRRNGGMIVVAYIDVVGLKAVNDSEGHAAGDALLKRVVTLVRSQLRTYDLIIRLGGDEFLCAMSNMALTDARDRLNHVSGILAGSTEPGGIRTGFAELGAREDAETLIARADAELVAGRHRRRQRAADGGRFSAP
jgi:diguanylate cyclase (GGDEF)-like protein